MDFFYRVLARYVSAAFLILAIGLAVKAILSHESGLWIGVAIFGVYGVVIGVGALTWTSLAERMANAQALENPLANALLALDWVDAPRLGELAAQKEVLPAPTRRERSRGRKRAAGLSGRTGPVQPNVSYESSESELAVYEMPENQTHLIRDLVGTLIRDGQIELTIGDVPRVSVDAPLDEKEIESLLIRELSQRSDSPDLRTVAREAASILGSGLPPERLASAKRDELDGLISGTPVLVEGEWAVAAEASEIELRLRTLHSQDEWDVATANLVEMPAAIEIDVKLEKKKLSRRAYARLQGTVRAGVFGEVLSSADGSVELWPIAVFSRMPSVSKASRED